MPEWDSEIEVSDVLASALIGEQFPFLDAQPLRRVGEGWDNTVWVNDQGIAFRFPRRAIAVPGVEREIAILPALSSQLPASIPDASYVGEASDAFPWPWFGSRLIVGREIAAVGLPPARRGRLASDLGAFLGCLHRLAPNVCAQLTVDPMGRANMEERIPRARAAVHEARSLWSGRELAERIFERAAAFAPDPETVLVHGDLNLRHALVSDAGGLAGVIDWGDMCRGPRSIDLPLYWSLFDSRSRVRFRVAYGEVTERSLAHARVLALFMDATLAVYAHDKGMVELEREALDGLYMTVTD